MSANVRALIPTISASRAANIAVMRSALESAGAAVTVIANSGSAARRCREAGVDHLDFGENRGFGFALNSAVAARADADWYLVLNDDLQIDEHRFAQAVSRLSATSGARIVFLDPEPWRRIPTAFDACLTLSLLGAVRRRREGDPGSGFKSFSAVAISASAWEETGGFDEVFAFNYEDVEFVRRARGRGVVVESVDDAGVAHEHSATGRQFIDVVLPVSAWSTREYLRLSGVSMLVSTAACLLALLVRAPMVVFVSGSKPRHLRGIGRSIFALVSGRQPRLPEYEGVVSSW